MGGDIQFVYFDLGNVLVNFDHSIAARRMSHLTKLPAEQLIQIIFDSGLQTKYETGLVNTDEFAFRFNEMAKTDFDNETLTSMISDVFWLNTNVFPVVAQIRNQGIPMAILSNTCPAHWEFVLAKFPIIKSLFEGCSNILSFQSKSMKPDAKIYQDAISAAGVPKEQIFFTDDRHENVESAIENGMNGHQFQSAHELARTFNELRIKINL